MTCAQQENSPDHDSDMDYEVVPAGPDEDVEMWDEADENIDELKQAHVKSESGVLSCLS